MAETVAVSEDAGTQAPVIQAPMIQAHIIRVLVAGQVLAGLGQGATLAIGAVIANEIAGEAFSGAAALSSTLGAAIAAIPLARLA